MTPVSGIGGGAARSAVLETADRVFYARGVAGVGMAEIRDESHVSLRRLYTLFGSKRGLVAAWLEERHRSWMDWFADSIERSRAAGVEPLLAAFDAIDSWAATPGYRGCAFLNTAAEVAEIDDTHRAIIAAHKRQLIAYLAGLASEGGHEPAEELAEMIGVLLDGSIVQSAVLSSRQPIAAARAVTARMIGEER
jgi:AcrR family transcriptional regulator